MKSSFTEENINPMDESYKVRLPQRDSNQLPERKEDPVSPASTRIQSPGLESVRSAETNEKEVESPWTEQADKEVYHEPPPSFYESKGPKKLPVGVHPAERPQQKTRKRWIIAGIVTTAICIAIALGVGLGVGLTQNRGSGSGVDADAKAGISSVGAFNGSGIAVASQSFENGGYGSIVMYFQHHSGQIRSAQLSTAGDWKGGDVTEVVAADAKNGTPISAVAYARDETATWHIFYINEKNFISEIINSNKTNFWTPGPISKLNLRPMEDPNVGLQACWYGSFYSDQDYKHSPVPGQAEKPTDSDQTVGIHLWYASNDTNFESYGWTYGQNSWEHQQSFSPYNGHAGVGCYSWGPGSDTYVIFTDLDSKLNILWKELNATLTGNQTHPINEWVASDVKIPVFQNTSIGYTNYLYAQNADLTFSGYNVTWASENTSVALDDPDQAFVISGQEGLPGSHLTVTSLPDSSGGNSLLAFYQTNGSDITEFVRDFDAGQWTSLDVPIPDT